jgi:hypothetical protein
MLTDYSLERWKVSTLSRTSYVIDLDSRTVTRSADVARYGPSRGISNGEPVPLVQLVVCEIGHTMIVPVELPGPWAKSPTLRSRMVTKIVFMNTTDVDGDAKFVH